MARFVELLSHWDRAELNQAEAAENLGVSERISALAFPLRGGGRRSGLSTSGWVGLRASGFRSAGSRKRRPFGFTAKHFHELLVRDHGFGWGRTWTKLFLQSKGFLAKAPRKGARLRQAQEAQARAAAIAGDDAASGRLAA